MYRSRRHRIEGEFGQVPPYADTAADVEPVAEKARRTGRLTEPQPDTVSAAEFEQMKRDLEIERGQPARHTSTLTKRLAHADEDGETKPAPAAKRRPASAGRAKSAPSVPEVKPAPPVESRAEEPVAPAPDVAENEGMVPGQKPKPRSKSRNRRHGRRR